MATKKKSAAKKSNKSKEDVYEIVMRTPPPQAPTQPNAFVGVPVTISFKDKDAEDLKGQFPSGVPWGGMFLAFETGGGKVLLNVDSIDQIWLDAPEPPPEPQDPVGVDV